MNIQEVIKQLESLRESQSYFIKNDSDGVFKNDDIALSIAIEILKERQKDSKADNYFRICSHCGEFMNKGYCIEQGAEYYCSDPCLHEHYTPEEWEKMYTDEGDNYYTEWY